LAAATAAARRVQQRQKAVKPVPARVIATCRTGNVTSRASVMDNGIQGYKYHIRFHDSQEPRDAWLTADQLEYYDQPESNQKQASVIGDEEAELDSILASFGPLLGPSVAAMAPLAPSIAVVGIERQRNRERWLAIKMDDAAWVTVVRSSRSSADPSAPSTTRTRTPLSNLATAVRVGEVTQATLTPSSSSAQQGRGATHVVLLSNLWASPAELWEIAIVALLLVALAWGVIALVLSLPLSLGRLLVRCILSAHAKKISDFLSLSLGVVVFSAAILAAVKIGEAIPALVTRASALENNRFLHLVVCAISSFTLAIASLLMVPLGLGTLLLRLVLPLKANSVYQVPIVFLVTDCWSLGLVLTKVVWRCVQSDMIFHSAHERFVSIQSAVQGSFTDLFFDTRVHRRIWRSLLLPMMSIIVEHLILPKAVAHTLVLFLIPEDQEYIRALLSMYCYHMYFLLQAGSVLVPITKEYWQEARQRIYDSKYRERTELQNYHHKEVADSSPVGPEPSPSASSAPAIDGAGVFAS